MWNKKGKLPDGPHRIIDVTAQVPSLPQAEDPQTRPEPKLQENRHQPHAPKQTRRPHDPETSLPEQIERLHERIAEMEERRAEEADELRELRHQQKDLADREKRINDREDAMFREIDAMRAKARRRERHEMEKAAHAVRVRAIKALGAMIGQAEKQAKLGKPALLRLILRSTR